MQIVYAHASNVETFNSDFALSISGAFSFRGLYAFEHRELILFAVENVREHHFAYGFARSHSRFAIHQLGGSVTVPVGTPVAEAGDVLVGLCGLYTVFWRRSSTTLNDCC